MTQKRAMILGGILVVFGAYVALTGGIFVYHAHDFGHPRDVTLVPGLKSNVWLVPRSSRFSIPFVFHSHTDGQPFGLRIEIWDESRQYQAIEITEVVAECKDGEVVRKADPWSRQLRPYADTLMLSNKIEGLVLRHADVKITLKGQLIKADGERVGFEITESFKAVSRSGITTYWSAVASW